MSPSSVALLLSLCALASVQAQLTVFNLRARDLSLLGTTDGYVKVYCDQEFAGKTVVRYNNKDPWWPEEFTCEAVAHDSELKLEVFDNDVLLDGKLGSCLRSIQKGTHQHECFLKRGGTLTYTYTYE